MNNFLNYQLPMSSHSNHKKNVIHNRAIKQIAKEYDLDESLVKTVIKQFFLAMIKLMIRNEEINIKGLFALNLSPHSKRKIKKYGKKYNFRKRRSNKK